MSGTEPKPIDQAGYLDLNSRWSRHSLRYSTSARLIFSFLFSILSMQLALLKTALSSVIEALTCADNIVTARLVIRHIATLHGVFASFMPKPLQGVPGSAMLESRWRVSVLGSKDWERGSPFWTCSALHCRSIKSPEYMLITNPSVLTMHSAYATWGQPPCYTRIPTHKPGKHVATPCWAAYPLIQSLILI